MRVILYVPIFSSKYFLSSCNF